MNVAAKKEKGEALSFFGALRFVNQFLDNMHLQLVLFYFGWLFDTIIGVLSPVLFGVMINQMVYYRNLSVFIQVGLAFFGLSVFSCIQYFLLYELYGHFWNGLIYRVRCRLYSVVLKMDARTMANTNYGDMAQLIQWQVMECVSFVVRNVIHNINNYINILICLVIAFLIQPWIALVLAVMVPVSVLISYQYGKRIREQQAKNQEAYGKYISWLYEIFNALRDIRLLGAEERVGRLFHKHQETLINTKVKAGFETLKAEHIIANSNTWIQMVLYAVLAFLAFSGGLSIGSVFVILVYFESLTESLRSVSDRYMDAQFRVSVIQRIKDLMEQPVEDRREDGKCFTVTQGDIRFQGLSFAYREGYPILENLDFHIHGGEKVAIVGESGCGKTTLSYMLLGFYEPQSGQIAVDGQNIAECSLHSIRDKVGVVQQDILIFDGTVRYNIMLGNENATEEELVRACRAAGVYDFIMEMEDQFDTVLGREGRELSGGQKQRIAIARTYLKNPPIIIFDEATASLDNETEAQIHEAWKKVLEGRTAIIIAHRQSSVMLCDRAAVMKNGQIVKTGAPEELLRNNDDFRKLFAIQEC